MTVEPVASIRVRARRVDVGVVDRLDALPPTHHFDPLVRDADRLHHPEALELLHRPPGVLDGRVIHLLRARRLDAAGNEGDREVHEVQVEAVDAQLGHRLEAALTNELRPMVALPQLGGDPQLRTRSDGTVGERLVERPSHVLLVHVDPCLVDVAVARCQGHLCPLVHLARL